MPILLQINTVCNSGSTGRIAEEIANLVIQKGWKSYIAYGRGKRPSTSITYHIGRDQDLLINAFAARLFDNDGFVRRKPTEQLVEYIKEIKPDIIHFHNLHGYYLNLDVLFKYLIASRTPIIWTLHDCWSFTGHCTHFDFINCTRWMTGCYSCPEKHSYPKSLLLDRSLENYAHKKELISQLNILRIVTPSSWLANLVRDSFLKIFPVAVINNGVNLKQFYPRSTGELLQRYRLGNRKVVLGVASIWNERKGLKYLVGLIDYLPADAYQIIIIGVTKAQKKRLPPEIIGIERTESIDELAQFYSLADVYVNPTLEDNFPTTNLEALACGTPVVTFKTGGSVEAIGKEHPCGAIVDVKSVPTLANAVKLITTKDIAILRKMCIERANRYYDAFERFKEYLNIYDDILCK